MPQGIALRPGRSVLAARFFRKRREKIFKRFDFGQEASGAVGDGGSMQGTFLSPRGPFFGFQSLRLETLNFFLSLLKS